MSPSKAITIQQGDEPMTKAELIERMKDLPDDAQITFALFVENRRGVYDWQLLNVNAQFRTDPADTIGLTTCPFHYGKITELSRIVTHNIVKGQGEEK
jgi:hypothetical protein